MCSFPKYPRFRICPHGRKDFKVQRKGWLLWKDEGEWSGGYDHVDFRLTEFSTKAGAETYILDKRTKIYDDWVKEQESAWHHMKNPPRIFP